MGGHVIVRWKVGREVDRACDWWVVSEPDPSMGRRN